MTFTSWWALIYFFVMTVICVQTETLEIQETYGCLMTVENTSLRHC